MRDVDMFPTAVARARRDLGIERAGDRADRNTAGWRESAATLVKDYAEQQRGKAFLTEDAAAYAHSHGLPLPPDGRAWGAAIQMAKRRGYVVAAGYAPARSSNLSPKVQWRKP